MVAKGKIRKKTKSQPKERPKKAVLRHRSFEERSKPKYHRSVAADEISTTLKRNHQLKVISFKEGSFTGSERTYKFQTSDGAEWMAVESWEGAESLAEDDIRQSWENDGVEGFSAWLIEDNLDKEAMLESLDEFIENDVAEGNFKSREAADKFFKDMIDSPDERIDWFSKETQAQYVDVDGLVEDAIKSDGVGHFIARVDGNAWETPNGFVYWKINN
jgi:hypothetical protein